MINRQAVIEYLHKHPNHSNWQMRLHFLQASRQLESQSQISIGSIANQLNFILRDLELIGTIAPRSESSVLDHQYYRSGSTTESHYEIGSQEQIH